jgi:hypothetical protein
VFSIVLGPSDLAPLPNGTVTARAPCQGMVSAAVVNVTPWWWALRDDLDTLVALVPPWSLVFANFSRPDVQSVSVTSDTTLPTVTVASASSSLYQLRVELSQLPVTPGTTILTPALAADQQVTVQGNVDVSGSSVSATVSGSVDATIQNAALTVQPASGATFDVSVQNASINANVSGNVNANITNATLDVQGNVAVSEVSGIVATSVQQLLNDYFTGKDGENSPFGGPVGSAFTLQFSTTTAIGSNSSWTAPGSTPTNYLFMARFVASQTPSTVHEGEVDGILSNGDYLYAYINNGELVLGQDVGGTFTTIANATPGQWYQTLQPGQAYWIALQSSAGSEAIVIANVLDDDFNLLATAWGTANSEFTGSQTMRASTYSANSMTSAYAWYQTVGNVSDTINYGICLRQYTRVFVPGLLTHSFSGSGPVVWLVRGGMTISGGGGLVTTVGNSGPPPSPQQMRLLAPALQSLTLAIPPGGAGGGGGGGAVGYSGSTGWYALGGGGGGGGAYQNINLGGGTSGTMNGAYGGGASWYASPFGGGVGGGGAGASGPSSAGGGAAGGAPSPGQGGAGISAGTGTAAGNGAAGGQGASTSGADAANGGAGGSVSNGGINYSSAGGSGGSGGTYSGGSGGTAQVGTSTTYDYGAAGGGGGGGGGGWGGGGGGGGGGGAAGWNGNSAATSNGGAGGAGGGTFVCLAGGSIAIPGALHTMGTAGGSSSAASASSLGAAGGGGGGGGGGTVFLVAVGAIQVPGDINTSGGAGGNGASIAGVSSGGGGGGGGGAAVRMPYILSKVG